MILHANAALSRRQPARLIALVAAGVTITAAALVVGYSRQPRRSGLGATGAARDSLIAQAATPVAAADAGDR